MMLFSQRNNLITDTEQLERFRTRTWNVFDGLMECFYRNCILSDKITVYESNYYVICSVADKMGIDITEGNIYSITSDLHDFVANAQVADRIYSFIEADLETLTETVTLPCGVTGVNIAVVQETAINMYERILRDENQPYKLYNNRIVPLVSEVEMSEIESASETTYDSVNRHIEKAWGLFSDRKVPDYENSVKESISAVESMCCIITGMTGAQATLGSAIKKLSDRGVHIHGSMKSAFSSLYGYTSDENGIRHGGIDFTNVPAEEARYMLVSCSAFVNYLIEKWNQVKSEAQG